MDANQQKFLSDEQIQQFLRDGVLVVDGVLTQAEVSHSLSGLRDTLGCYGVESFSVDDEASARSFSKLSSTNGSGGVLDLFYEAWKMEIATNPKLFSITQQLWSAGYCHNGESRESLSQEETFQWHPFGPFNCTKGYAYIDRVGYRLPSEIAQKIGDRIHPDRKKKARALQRSLTPHLDCCPNSMYTDSAKWRPIQCFVSLSDSLEPNTGGFEAAKGFHHEFDEWASTRVPTLISQKHPDGSKSQVSIPAPCVGQYTHFRPKEDKDIMDRVTHVPVRAGSAVFWDNRIPHANAYKHNGDRPRAVVYCSFLPDVELNRTFVKKQLSDFQQGKPPRDQWNHIDENYTHTKGDKSLLQSFTPLGRRLMGIEEWTEDEKKIAALRKY
jgi:hypothetical protein